MCGIVGIYQKHTDTPANGGEILRAMCDAMVHRGPDGEGYFLDGPLAMGMRRLSVIDLSTGRQPIYNEDKTIAVVFNGEIFNYVELRKQLESDGHVFRTKSDTEVLVHGYEKWGEELPQRLNGMFAFSIWDSKKKRLFLARDHLGVKPLYLYEDREIIVWASEIKAILVHPNVNAELNREALFDFMQFGYVPAPRTMFRGIKKLEPATTFSIDREKVSEWKYWKLEFATVKKTTEEWCEELQYLFEDVVKRQLLSDVPIGAFLSGGLDSSAIVATMHRLNVKNISTYAIGFGEEDSFHNELEKAKSVANQFETNHHEIVVKPNVTDLMFPLVKQLDEPVTDTSFIVTYLVSQLARESVTVILSGVGGDEIFAGYRRYLGPKLQSIYSKVPGPIRRRLVKPIVNRLPIDRGSWVKSFFRYAKGFTDSSENSAPEQYQGYVSVYNNGQRAKVLSREFAALESKHQSQQIADFYDSAQTNEPLNRMLFADMKTSLVDSLLAFTDKMSMAVSLEARVPFLDYRLVELTARIPANLKLKGINGLKHIFKESMKDRLSKRIISQKKQGFGTPVSRWLRNDLKPLLHDCLSENKINERGYFDPKSVQKLIEDHDAQRADYSEHILALLTFEVWHQAYLD